MSKENHTVSPEFVETVEYRILIIGHPKEDIEDLLTNLVTERGRIAKSMYEDFLIANCIANLNQFMAHITVLTSEGTGSVDLLKVRKEVTQLILKHNPVLEPKNIVINKNKVLKLKTDDNIEDSMPLKDNSFWNQSYYDSDGNYNPTPSKDGKTSIYSRRPTDTSKENEANEKIKDIDELPFTKTKAWWDRIGEYIIIKKYSMDDIDKILKFRYFHNSTSFNTFVVSSCVVDVEEIYERIDGMGANVDPRKVIQELFSICEGVNEGLNFSRFKELRTDEELEEDSPKYGSAAQKAKKTTADYKKSTKKGKKLTFRDVPKADLLALNHNMKMSLVGQNEAVDKLTEAIKRASVGLKDPLKPIGSFLFAGRTGCGKTLATKILADELIRTKKNRIIIDCSEYTLDHEYAKLIGAPAGYIGHDSGGILTNGVSENPFSVVVFDEIEKASTKVYDLLLQILDEGRLTDGKGQSVSFKDTIIVMTSNIGVKEVDDVEKTIGFGDVALLTEEKKGKALSKALKNKFRPEFLNRIDAIVNFKDLTDDDYMKIIGIELDKLREHLKANDTEYKSIKLSFDKKIKSFIFDKGVDDKFGARPIKRAIERYVSNKIASLLLEEEVSPTAEIKVTSLKSGVKLKVIDNEAPKFLAGAEGSK